MPPNHPPTISSPLQHTTFFFYGTLMAPAVLQRVTSHDTLFPRQPLSAPRPALLRNHRRHCVKHGDYPAVVPSKEEGAAVKGTVVEGFVYSDIWRLDVFEGEEYERRVVKVVVPKDRHTQWDQTQKRGHQLEDSAADVEEEEKVQDKEEEEIEAYTYIWTVGQQHLEDSEWDYDGFVREKMWRWAEGHAQADPGFEDIERATQDTQEERQNRELGGQNGADPTGGRMLGGAFEKAVQGGSKEVEDDAVESAV